MRNLYVLIIALCVAVAITIYPSCTKDYFEPVEIDIPDTVSFSQYIIPIFSEHCAISGCHETGGVAPDLTPDNAWSDLWLYGFVDTTSPPSSELYERMISNSEPMPPSGKLTGGQDQLVLAWIEQGALDN